MQMINKEEIEAIKKLKKYALCNFDENGEIETYANGYKWILLNLIDKQENRIKELEEIEKDHQEINGNLQKRIDELENILKGKSIQELGISELYNDNHIPHID